MAGKLGIPLAVESVDIMICLRETWRHMATVSGFDPLFAALEDCFSGKSTKYLCAASFKCQREK